MAHYRQLHHGKKHGIKSIGTTKVTHLDLFCNCVNVIEGIYVIFKERFIYTSGTTEKDFRRISAAQLQGILILQTGALNKLHHQKFNRPQHITFYCRRKIGQ
jgi:hypothetical protein